MFRFAALIPSRAASVLARPASAVVCAIGCLVAPLAAHADEPTAAPAATAPTPVPATTPVAAPVAEAVASTPTDAASTPLPVAVAESKAEDKKPWPWSGAVSFRNLTSTTLLAPDYEQSYLPYEGLGLLITPRYKLNDTMSIGLWQYSTVELTNTGNTTYYREPQLSDTTLSFSWTALNTMAADKNAPKTDVKVPPHGFALNVQGILGLPTSKASWAKQLYSTLGVGVGGRYVWHGLTVGLTTRFSHSFYKTTQMQYASQPITTCSGEAAGCDPALLSSGVRSPEWRAMAIGSVSYSITEKLGVSVSAGEIMDWLPSLASATISIPGVPKQTISTADDQNFRALMYWGAGVDYSILAWLSAGIGLETYNSQLKANSTYETPMINRYTTAYLELSLALDGLPH